MIDTTEIGYGIFYAYGFITEDRFAKWREKPSAEDPTKTNEQYTIEQTEEKIAQGRREAEICGMVSLYDEWIETERAYFAHLQDKKEHAFDKEGIALQRKRFSLAQKVKLQSLGEQNG